MSTRTLITIAVLSGALALPLSFCPALAQAQGGGGFTQPEPIAFD